MKKNIFDTVANLLLEQDKYVSEDGTILKATVYSDIMTMDEEIINLLVDNEEIREHFFVQVGDTLVFDKQQFAWLLDSKEFLPDSYTIYDNKIGLTDSSDNLISKKQDVSLVWPYKDCILEGGQTKEAQKRDEVFYNETLAPDEVSRLLEPKVLTNAKRYSVDGIEENIKFHAEDNLIIKGNNLLALSTLLPRYEGKIKLIYIDPPYNTGSDSFNYNDNFNHSTWLTFMKNRLELSKKLLNDNGVMIVQCDDNEQAYLKVLMDEIFSEDKFINTVVVKSSTPSGLKTAHKEKTIIKQKDYLHFYKKDEVKIKPNYTIKHSYDTHYNGYLDKNNMQVYRLVDILRDKNILNEDETLKDINLDNKNHMDFLIENRDCIYQTAPEMPEQIKEKSLQMEDIVLQYGSGDNPQYAYNGRRLTFLSSTFNDVLQGSKIVNMPSNLLCDFWDDIDFQNTQNQGGVSFPSGKKPEQLIYRLIDMFTEENDIILDFFMGSATTQAVAMKMNRRFIGVEQMDYISTVSVPRLQNVIDGEQGGISRAVNWEGGGSFVYCELLENSNKLIKLITKADESNINQIKEKIYIDERIVPHISTKELESADEDFLNLSLEDKKRVLLELVDKNKLYINLSDINDNDSNVNEADKLFTKSFYGGIKDE